MGTREKGHLFQGNKCQLFRGTGNKDNIGKQGKYENTFSILGEQGNMPTYFRGTRGQVALPLGSPHIGPT